jgi:hypothetical protein
MLTTPASPSPNPTPSVGTTLLEDEVEKSVEIGMATLEKLPRFVPDPALEAAPPPLVTEVGVDGGVGL